MSDDNDDQVANSGFFVCDPALLRDVTASGTVSRQEAERAVDEAVGKVIRANNLTATVENRNIVRNTILECVLLNGTSSAMDWSNSYHEPNVDRQIRLGECRTVFGPRTRSYFKALAMDAYHYVLWLESRSPAKVDIFRTANGFDKNIGPFFFDFLDDKLKTYMNPAQRRAYMNVMNAKIRSKQAQSTGNHVSVPVRADVSTMDDGDFS